MFEACGDAIRAIIGSADERASSEWHEAKLRALGGHDRDKKLLALRHLDSADFDDDLMYAAVIESLERDDDTLALTFAVTAGSLIDPARKEGVLRLLLDELHRYERRGQSRAAFFGVLLFHIYENHAGAVPPDWLISEWTSSVAASEDPASFAALVDLCALAVSRSADAAIIERLLSSDRPTEWLLAADAVKRMDIASVDEPLRQSIRRALADARTRWSSAGGSKLAPEHAQWLDRTIDELLQ